VNLNWAGPDGKSESLGKLPDGTPIKKSIVVALESEGAETLADDSKSACSPNSKSVGSIIPAALVSLVPDITGLLDSSKYHLFVLYSGISINSLDTAGCMSPLLELTVEPLLSKFVTLQLPTSRVDAISLVVNLSYSH
jgi:hypothetical protein